MGPASLKCANNLKNNKTQKTLPYPKDNSLFNLKSEKGEAFPQQELKNFFEN